MLRADLHVHEEWSARLDRVLARRRGLLGRDWSDWRERLAGSAPGIARLQQLGRAEPAPMELDDDEAFVERVADLLRDSAASGAGYAEVRFDERNLARADFMDLFRRAEEQVGAAWPDFRAEALVSVTLWDEPDRLRRSVRRFQRAAARGLAGVDLLNVPYTSRADWSRARDVIGEARSAGLGVTVHVGEFADANLAAVAELEGVDRLGHAVHAAWDQRLLELLAERAVTVECCLTANALLGAVPEPSRHPLPRFLAAGVPVALGTDHPVRLGTDVAAEYRAAAALGLDHGALRGLTEAALDAAFGAPDRLRDLRDQLSAEAAAASFEQIQVPVGA